MIQKVTVSSESREVPEQALLTLFEVMYLDMCVCRNQIPS